jgi:hypothetical protein
MINQALTHRLNVPVTKETWEAVNKLSYAAHVKPTTFTRSIVDMYLESLQTKEQTNDQPISTETK